MVNIFTQEQCNEVSTRESKTILYREKYHNITKDVEEESSQKLEPELLDRVTEGTKEPASTLKLTETRHDEKVHCKMKYKYVTNMKEERNMTEECQSVSKAKYSTEKDTVTKQECKGVHSRVEYRDMAGQEYKHGPMDMVNDLKLLGWENKVTEWDDDRTGAKTLLCL